MPNLFFRVPDNLVREWPEVFEDMWMSTMPVSYLQTLQIEFKNGRVWEINVKEQLKKSSPESLSTRLVETFREYRDTIKKVDFQLDIDRLKKDILTSTKDLL